MSSLFFWKEWHKEYRYTWYAMLGLFLTALVFLWVSYAQGADAVISWQRLQEQKEIETSVHSFRLGPFELTVPGETYIIFEYLNGSTIKPNTTASYLFLVILTLSAIILLSVITTAERFWFFIAMGLFILFVVSFRLEVLGLFGLFNRVPTLIVLTAYILPAFYFNRIRSSTPFLTRLAVFGSITLLFSIIIAMFATVNFPFYQLTITSFVPGLILSILFIIMVSHEIISSFVIVISQGNSKSLNHLLIISTIYLINIIITCFHEIGVIDWSFLYINLYLLLTISALLGIWGFCHREALYGNIVSFYPFGALFFLAMGAICFATTAQLLGNANDPGVRIIRDVIIFSHTGFGFIFLIYLFSNYSPMLAKNLPVHKVLYTPTRMPYFTYRFAGLIVMLAFIFNSNWRQYVYHGISAFYNSGGDLYALEGNFTYAESFYEKARAQAFQNHRSNYALGSMRGNSYDLEDARDNYDDANSKRPTAYSLTNEGNTYFWEQKYYDAIRTYKNGLEKINNTGPLANNLGLSYIKIHRIDSAAYFLNQAREYKLTKNAAETNFFAMAAVEMLPMNPDSVLRTFNSDFPGTLCNALALSTVVNKPFKIDSDPLADSVLNLYTATFLNNYIIKNAKEVDTTFINRAYAIASDSLNADYSEALKSSLSFAYYHQGNIQKALEILAEQIYLSQSYQGTFNYIMGLWALEQLNPESAAIYFSYADNYEFENAPFYMAIAQTEAGQIETALKAWDTVAVRGNRSQRLIAGQIKRILTLSSDQVQSLTDAEKYQFCRYRIGLEDSVLFNRISNSFDNPNYKAQALLDLSRKYQEAGDLVSAIYYYQRIAGLELSDKRLYHEFRHFELILLATRREINLLAEQINNGIEFDASKRLEKIYYTALITEASGDTATARKNYTILANYNPYFEDGILSAYQFFLKHSDIPFYPYNILAEAVQVNTQSIRLWRAYYNEAVRIGFDEYAASAAKTIAELEAKGIRNR